MKKLLILLILCLTACTKSGDEIRPIEKEKGSAQSTELSEKDSKPDNMEQSLVNIDGTAIRERFAVPEGFERVEAEEGSFQHYLRNLPLKPHGSKVLYYNGKEKNKKVYDAVIDMDTGSRDLQQCADAVMRLRAEYLYHKGLYDRISFNFTNGFKAEYSKWMEGYRIIVNGNNARWVKQAGYSSDYKEFRKYMDMVFAYAGTISLSAELKPVELSGMKIGDVFIQADPGHCVIVVDMAQNKSTGQMLYMIAQSYMPAQDIHILKNPKDQSMSPWYAIGNEDKIKTPEWEFKTSDLKRFED